MLIQVYLKAPQPGRVKTRLARDLGDEEACRIYRRLVTRQLSALPASLPKEIHFAPADAVDDMRHWLGEAWTLIPQIEGSLGKRLARGIQDGFSRSHGPVCVIGGDCPTLTETHFHQAQQLLHAGYDAVFGPARDGGYYLLALRAFYSELFSSIPWSCPETLAASVAAAKTAGRKLAFLELLQDVDTLDDWQKLAPCFS